jgi:hypothetical protein
MVISLLPGSAAVCFVEEGGYHERQDLSLSRRQKSVASPQLNHLRSFQPRFAILRDCSARRSC